MAKNRSGKKIKKTNAGNVKKTCNEWAHKRPTEPFSVPKKVKFSCDEIELIEPSKCSSNKISPELIKTSKMWPRSVPITTASSPFIKYFEESKFSDFSDIFTNAIHVSEPWSPEISCEISIPSFMG